MHHIVKEYASKHRRLPGLRSSTSIPSRTSGPVQLYQEARNGILRRYIQPWLAKLYVQDPDLYVDVLYEQCRAIPPLCASEQGIGKTGKTAKGNVEQLALERMLAAVDCGIAYGCLPDLLMMWLHDLEPLHDKVAHHTILCIPRWWLPLNYRILRIKLYPA